MHQNNGVLSKDMLDEIRILIKGEQAFGTLTFSIATKTHYNYIRI